MFGILELWSDSMDTLIITGLSVLICMVIGLPTGIWMARSRAASTFVTPILDVMQTLPAFCYLAPDGAAASASGPRPPWC